MESRVPAVALGPGEVHLWVVAESSTPTAAAMRLQAQRLLTEVLSLYRAAPVALAALQRTNDGKPYLPEGPCFSLSHAEDALVVAVSQLGELGVDIERLTPWIPSAATIRHVWGRAGAPPTVDGFYRCWTRSEAMIKAIGTGWKQPLDTVASAAAWAPGEPSIRRVAPCGPREALILADLLLLRTHAAAVAVATTRDPAEVRLRTYRCDFLEHPREDGSCLAVSGIEGCATVPGAA